MSTRTATTETITTLRDEAGQAGDLAMVAVCDRALAGDADAITECQRVMDDAAAADAACRSDDAAYIADVHRRDMNSGVDEDVARARAAAHTAAQAADEAVAAYGKVGDGDRAVVYAERADAYRASIPAGAQNG